MRHSKKSSLNLAIKDVLRVVSSADQEAFNAAMESAYLLSTVAMPQVKELELRGLAAADDLVGAELWMLNFDESDEESTAAAESVAGAIGFHTWPRGLVGLVGSQ